MALALSPWLRMLLKSWRACLGSFPFPQALVLLEWSLHWNVRECTFVGARVHFFDVIVDVVVSCVSSAVFVVECLVAFVSDIVVCVLLRRRVVSERPPGTCWSKLIRYILKGQTCDVAL